MNPKGPSRTVALVTEITELFDQRLWSFCSEITELLIRDYGAFVQRLQSL
jgi:hypothetical protein